MTDIVLTQDQTELLLKLDDFLINNKLSFGLYGPAGSGKSFTIGYFIQKNNLFERIILTGTTNNACRVLEESLEKVNPNIDSDIIINRIECLLSDIYTVSTDLVLSDFSKDKTSHIDNAHISYIHKIKEFISICKDKLQSVKPVTPDILQEIRKDISEFINENIFKEKDTPLLITMLNNKLINLLTLNKYIKTIHSLLCFEQLRDEKHNIVFLPGKSNIEEHTIENKKTYNFSPKLSSHQKRKYESLNTTEERIYFEKKFYQKELKGLEECEMIIVDESSMLKELEYKYIMYVCKILRIKIIFLGDKYQLPPVENSNNDKDNDLEEINEINEINNFVDFSPAVKIKNSYTLTTIKRTDNLVLQEVYKSYRDMVEKSSQGKTKLQNLQYTKFISPASSYLIKMRNDIQDVVSYIQSKNNKDIRILCFSNSEVEKMNKLMRTKLYGDITEPYIKDEKLLVTNYMILPQFNIEKMVNIEYWINHSNRTYFNYFFNKLLGFEYKVNFIDTEYKKIDTTLNQDIKNDGLKLYTSCFIKILKVHDCQVCISGKVINVSIVIFDYEGNVSFFFHFKNKKDNDYIKKLLKEEKENIKITGELFRLHTCNEKCVANTNTSINLDKKSIDKHEKKEAIHSCLECDKPEMCIHYKSICDSNCKLLCRNCNSCDSSCLMCVKQHKNKYITGLWNHFTLKEHFLNPSVNYSYATTVHKAQGQSIDNVIVCEYNIANCILHKPEVTEVQKFLLYPTCMYTAITRSKNILVRLK
jgi:hypothetical protein